MCGVMSVSGCVGERVVAGRCVCVRVCVCV